MLTERKAQVDFDLEHIPDRLRELREEREWTQTELARRCEIPQPMVAYWETGTRQMTLKNAALVCTALGVGLDELCGWHHGDVCATER